MRHSPLEGVGMKTLVRVARRWWGDESAQELAEYAWLAFSVGLVGLLLWPIIVGLLSERYTDYIGDRDPNNISGVQQLWDQPPPP
jgi:hypothetical protein